MRTGILIVLTFFSIVACKLKPTPGPALTGGNSMKVEVEILSLNQDSTAQVFVQTLLKRNSSPLTHSLQNADTVDFYFSLGHEGFISVDDDANTYRYPKLKIKDTVVVILVVQPNLNSPIPFYKVVWYKKTVK